MSEVRQATGWAKREGRGMSEGETNEGVTEAAAEEKAGSWKDAIRGNVLAMGLVSLFTDFSSEMMNPLLPIYVLGLVAPGPGAVKAAVILVGLMEGIAGGSSRRSRGASASGGSTLMRNCGSAPSATCASTSR